MAGKWPIAERMALLSPLPAVASKTPSLKVKPCTRQYPIPAYLAVDSLFV